MFSFCLRVSVYYVLLSFQFICSLSDFFFSSSQSWQIFLLMDQMCCCSEDLRHVKDNKVEFSFLLQRVKTSQIHRLARERLYCGLGEAWERRLGMGWGQEADAAPTCFMREELAYWPIFLQLSQSSSGSIEINKCRNNIK